MMTHNETQHTLAALQDALIRAHKLTVKLEKARYVDADMALSWRATITSSVDSCLDGVNQLGQLIEQ